MLRWEGASSDPQWIKINLGTKYNINKVILYWETAYAKSYKIQVSNDDINWTDVYSTTSGDGGIDEITFSQKNVKYIRMYGTQRGTGYGYSLWEFEVYGNIVAGFVMPAKLEIGENDYKLLKAVKEAKGGENIKIEYNVKSGKAVEFEIYNIEGEKVNVIKGENGYAELDGKDGSGREVGKDVYIIIMRVDGVVSGKPRKVGIR